ncbi:MAG: hypothetical protein K2W85_15505 [Phycisphaerales bacterium]|nr:hypothetical protein [Phycisphaerales bacterium]
MSTVSPDLIASAPVSPPNPRRRLIVGNVVLLAILAGVTLLNTRFAGAQPERVPSGGRDGGGARLRGEYTMVSGRTQGVTTSTIYVIDAVSQEIVAINWDRNTSKPEVIGLRSLAEDSRFLQRTR